MGPAQGLSAFPIATPSPSHNTPQSHSSRWAPTRHFTEIWEAGAGLMLTRKTLAVPTPPSRPRPTRPGTDRAQGLGVAPPEPAGSADAAGAGSGNRELGQSRRSPVGLRTFFPRSQTQACAPPGRKRRIAGLAGQAAPSNLPAAAACNYNFRGAYNLHIPGRTAPAAL